MTTKTIKAMVAEAQAKGEKTFDPGRPCLKGHISHRYALENAPCIKCLRSYEKNNRENRPGWKPRPAISVQQPNGLWIGDPCPKCGDVWRTNPDRKCVSCRKINNRKTSDKKRRISRESYHRNLEANREKKRAQSKKHADLRREITAKNRAENIARKKILLSKEQRSWIKDFYKNRPEGYEVDHIVGLKSKLCCGLHIPANLQYLSKSENRRKSRKWPTCQRSTQPAWFDELIWYMSAE